MHHVLYAMLSISDVMVAVNWNFNVKCNRIICYSCLRVGLNAKPQLITVLYCWRNGANIVSVRNSLHPVAVERKRRLVHYRRIKLYMKPEGEKCSRIWFVYRLTLVYKDYKIWHNPDREINENKTLRLIASDNRWMYSYKFRIKLTTCRSNSVSPTYAVSGRQEALSCRWQFCCYSRSHKVTWIYTVE